MIRLKLWRALALAVFAAALPAHAGEVYQISTISSLLAGGYDGDTTVAELLRHGSFGLGTFNGVDGEMMVLDGRVYRGTIDGRAHAVAESALTPFAVVVEFRPQPRRPRPRPDHRRGSGLARGMLGAAHQLARAGAGIERRRRCNQGGGTPAVTSRAQVRLLGTNLTSGAAERPRANTTRAAFF